MHEPQTDILVVGGGVGGMAGALAALEMGRDVILVEESDWIGGQLTAQAVPPDEHPWIEYIGATASYRRFREGVRACYRRHYPLLPHARNDPTLNPGNGWVSRLCHEPRVALVVLQGMLAPYIANGQLQLWLNTEHVMGTEAGSDTGELHAPDQADPLDQQAVTWCFPMSYHEGEDHTIDKPRDYDFWRDYQAEFWPDKQLSWNDPHPHTNEKRHVAVFAHLGEDPTRDFWQYRRIVDASIYPEGWTTDVTLVNWPQIDYWLGPVVGVPDEERQKHLDGARQFSLSMMYWMQTEAPRHDGGTGYPGLKLRPELVDTDDGLAKRVYIGEARRVKAEFTVLEEHVGVQQRAETGLNEGAAQFSDSVGIGSYRIDLHPSTGLSPYVDIESWPFQVPLGALMPKRVGNLLPANKNIGTTHMTNGCYRLHPVECNIGEAAGAVAAWSLAHDTHPSAVRNDEAQLRAFQGMLVTKRGIQLAWPDFGPPA